MTSLNFDKSKIILFYTPEAGVEPHMVAQCVIAKSLQNQGYQVAFTRCFELFPRCPVMDMHQLPEFSLELPRGAHVCQSCVHSSSKILSHFGLPLVDLRELYTQEVASEINAAITAAPPDLRDFIYDGIAFGKLSTIDLALNTKRYKFSNLSEKERNVWLVYIKASITSYVLSKRLFQALPVGRVVYFNDYSLLLGARLAAERESIPAFYSSLASHCAVDRRRAVLTNKPWRLFLNDVLEEWHSISKIPLAADLVKDCADDALARLGAKSVHVYSPPKTFEDRKIHEKLGLDRKKKTLVAYTSSLDEFIAAHMNMEVFGGWKNHPQPFATDESVQISWLRGVIQYVESRDDLQLVVRVHPREGRNKRDGMVSQHFVDLEAALSRPFKNCKIIWPEEQVSSYDLGEIADVALTTFSNIGLEMARLGIPVLAAYKGVTIADVNFIQWASTAEAYFRKLNELLQSSPSLDTIRSAYRYYNAQFLGPSVFLGDVIPSPDFNGLPEVKSPANQKVLEDAIIGGQRILDQNLQALKARTDPQAEDLELRRQCRRIIHFLYTGEDRSEDFNLVLVDVRSEGPVNLNLENRVDSLNSASATHFLIKRGADIHYSVLGKVHSKYSPLCSRLATLSAQFALTV